MENPESKQFRDNLANEIKEAPKNERQEILGNAKKSADYWQARSEKIHERQGEEEVDDGFGIFLKNKSLYHGSGTSGIDTLDKAEEETVGSGVYLTSEAKDAIGYARRRARTTKSSPVIYESSVENLKLLDLRKDENVKRVLDGFKQILATKLKTPNLKWYQQAGLQKTIDSIDSGEIHAGNLGLVTSSTNQEFSDYCKSLGYDGLATFEGGEGKDIGDHDTFLIFDPKKVRINQEHQIV